jgi:regulator of protease activity HflC (stomatin/prohibitin superfamily)
MFGYIYFKPRPTDYVVIYSGGRARRQGQGLAGFVFRPWTTASAVPTDARDDIFAVEAMTQDFQTVTVQGLLTFRIVDAPTAAARQDFNVNLATGQHIGEPMKQIVERLRGIVQTACRDALVRLPLADALSTSDALSRAIKERVASDAKLKEDGIGVDRVLVLSVKPAPEIRKALEADLREQLLRRADAAMFERRRAATTDEHELKLKDEKNKRELAETELGNQLALEEERRRLAEAKAETLRTEAEAQARAVREQLKPFAELPPKQLAAIALRDWAIKGGQISSLSLGGDVLNDLAAAMRGSAGK